VTFPEGFLFSHPNIFLILCYSCSIILQDESRPKGPQAAGWRQRKFDLLRRFPIPLDLLPGSLTVSRTRCGKPSCHCAEGQGHEAWTFTFMSHGKRRVERIPKIGSTTCASAWRPDVSFTMRCERFSPPTPNCSFWRANSSTNRDGELAFAARPAPLRRPVSRLGKVFAPARRWPGATPDCRSHLVVVDVDRPSAARDQLPCRGTVGALVLPSLMRAAVFWR